MKIQLSCRGRAFGLGAIALLVVSQFGCSSSVDHRADRFGGEGGAVQRRDGERASSPRPEASQGGSWELVFATPGVSGQVADAGSPEYGRLDATMNSRQNGPVTAMSYWPESPRPDLGRARSVRVRDSERSFIYYFPTSGRRGSSGGGSDRSGWWY